MHRLRNALGIGLVVLSFAGTSAAASDATLRVAVNSWSKRIAADAQAVTRDAKVPSRLTADAVRFRSDALRARAVISARRPGTAKGRRARRLALTAFGNFARAGADWAASGRARILHQRASAIADAQAGARAAHGGNLLLVEAGKLLRP